MDFYTQFINSTNNACKHKINLHTKYIIKKAEATASVGFLLKCRDNSIIPNFIERSTKNIMNQIYEKSTNRTKLENTIYNFQFKLLNIHIREKYSIISGTEKMLMTLEDELKIIINEDDLLALKYWWTHEYNIKHFKKQQILIKKYNTLRQSKLKLLKLTFDPKFFINKTNAEFPDEVKWLISLGPKFNIFDKSSRIPIFHLIAEIETALQHINTEERDIKRNTFTNILMNFKHKHDKNDFIRKYINIALTNTKKFLKINDNIAILCADKGNIYSL